MIIKKFQAKTEAEAVNAAKKELGAEFGFMNARSLKRGGLFGFLRPQLVEITVALEEETDYPRPKEQKPLPPLTPSAASAAPAQPAPAPRRAEPRPPAAVAPNPDIIPDEKPEDEHKNGNAILEEKLDSLQSLLEQQLHKPEEETPEPEEAKEQTEMYQFLRLLYSKMIDNEIIEKYANQIIEEVDKNNKPNMPFDYALSNVYQKMILKFGKPETIAAAQTGPKVVFFVGPTGVGKTTTIAKIASRFSVDERKRVALLTTDTYRIAAAEQLKTYASILGIPFTVLYSKEEMLEVLKEYHEYDYVLVDTAGHSHHNETQRRTMAEFINALEGVAEKEVFLVVSATTKYRDLMSVADTYREMGEYKLIFTKLDETSTLGSLFNLKLHTGAPLSYVTYGQNVPDDIEEFNPQKTVKQLLGGKV
jgi:flagellar biosynthesis protein FlhF